MRIKTIARVTRGRIIHGAPGRRVDPGRIMTDTRTLRPGDFFCALVGPRYDGSSFIGEAFAKGAAGAIAMRRVTVPQGRTLILVKDTTKALGQIAAYHRMRFRIPVIAVTGSNGKTTVKDMIAAVLGAEYPVLASEGTKNNHIGVPQTLLRLTARHRACVLELGMNHAGEIRRLGRIARQTIAVMTTIGPSHLAFLKDLDGVFAAKRELLETFDRRRRGTAVVCGDDPYLATVKGRGFSVVRYGFGEDNDLRATITGRGTAATAFVVNGTARFAVPLLGDHNVANALAAVAVGRLCGVSDRRLRTAAAGFAPSSMRLAPVTIRGISVINDAYNSNPLSMERALEVIRAFPAAGKWVVSADMLELGPRARTFHRQVGALAARSGVKGLVTFGELSRETLAGARHSGMPDRSLWQCGSHDEVAAVLRRKVKKGDVVLIKGSRRMRMEEVLEKFKGQGSSPKGEASHRDKGQG